jgi:hypothetical protein
MANFLANSRLHGAGEREQSSGAEPDLPAVQGQRHPRRTAVRPRNRQHEASAAGGLGDHGLAARKVIAPHANEIEPLALQRVDGHRDRHLLGREFLTWCIVM